MAASSNTSDTKITTNRKAFRDYHVLEKHEAGIELCGTEVKAIRQGHISLSGSYARIEDGQVLLYNLTIPAYEHGNRFNHEPARVRRLLLHRSDILRFHNQTERQGFTLVPLSMYIRRGWVKLELGLCRGKTHGDKRETLRKKTADMQAARAMARHR